MVMKFSREILRINLLKFFVKKFFIRTSIVTGKILIPGKIQIQRRKN